MCSGSDLSEQDSRVESAKDARSNGLTALQRRRQRAARGSAAKASAAVCASGGLIRGAAKATYEDEGAIAEVRGPPANKMVQSHPREGSFSLSVWASTGPVCKSET
jgi:hypothetical protein